MFQYPGYFAYQMPSLARANLQAWLSVSGRFASGLQAIADLNAQTVRTVVEESNALLRGSEQASPGDFLGWQSVMFAQLPQKAASYGQHVFSIITATEAEIIGEVRDQYERNGITLKRLFDTAAADAQQGAESSSALVTDLADATSEAAQQTSAAILDANGDIADATGAATESAAASAGAATETAIVKATRSASRRHT